MIPGSSVARGIFSSGTEGAQTPHLLFDPRNLGSIVIPGPPDRFDSIPNSGTLGGTFSAAVALNRPAVSTWNGHRVADYTASNARLDCSASAASLWFLLDTSATFLMTMRVRFGAGAFPSTAMLIFTGGSSNTFRVYRSSGGSLHTQRFASAGMTRSCVSAVSTINNNTAYTIQLYATPTIDYLIVNGSVVATATATFSPVLLGAPLAVGGSFSQPINGEVAQMRLTAGGIGFGQVTAEQLAMDLTWP